MEAKYDNKLVKRLLKRSGMTVDQWAMLCGVSRQTAWRWAKGWNRPDVTCLQILACCAHTGPVEVDGLMRSIDKLKAAYGYLDSKSVAKVKNGSFAGH